jgi:pimeloyl-ACP methyl ester carboxylesterase
MAIDVGQIGAGFREGFVEADGFRTRYLEAGSGEPLVVLHGGGGLRRYRSHDLLAASHRVVLFEMPGFGASDANERTGSMAEMARTVAQAARSLGIERFDLQGTSFGGRVATWLAVQNPELVRALVLISPATMLPDAAPGGGRLLLYAHPERQVVEQADPESVARQRALTARIMGPRRDADLEARMTQCNVPALVIFGTEDGQALQDMGRLYREKLPDCSLVYVYDAAHEVDADRPEAVVSLVNDFLSRHAAFVVNNRSSLIYP